MLSGYQFGIGQILVLDGFEVSGYGFTCSFSFGRHLVFVWLGLVLACLLLVEELLPRGLKHVEDCSRNLNSQYRTPISPILPKLTPPPQLHSLTITRC
jgi:hypothetical protein